MATSEEIKANAFKLEKAGASETEIEQYVSEASKELTQTTPVATTEKPSLFSNIVSQAKTFPSTVSTVAKSFFPSMLRGLTFNKMGGEQPSLAGSVMEPPLEKTARQAGSLVGQGTQAGLMDVLSGGVVNPIASKLGVIPFVSSIAKNAMTGGTLFGGRNVAEQGIPKTGEQAGNLASDVAKGAALFSGVGLAGHIASDLTKYLGGEFSGTMIDHIIGTAKKQAKSDIVAGDFEHLGSKVADIPNMTGSKKTLLDKSASGIDDIENQIQKTLEPYIKEEQQAQFSSISTDKVAESFNNLENRFKGTIGTKSARDAVEEFKKELYDTYGKAMTIEQAQQLKRNTWALIKDNSFLKDLKDTPLQAQLQRSLGQGLRKEIVNAVPDIAELNARQGILIGLRNTVQDSLAGETGNVIEKLTNAVYDPSVTGLARGMRKFETSTIVKPVISEVSKQGSRLAAPSLIDLFKRKNEIKK